MDKRTKIVCTLGPSSHTKETIQALAEAGMNVCRLNFSHGTREDHAELIRLIRAVTRGTGLPLTILQDLQGPKIRVGMLPEAGRALEKDQAVIFSTRPAPLPDMIPVTYERLHQDMKEGERILLDDGLLSAVVTHVEGQDVSARVVNGGRLFSHKGMNVPDTKTSVPSLSDKDKDDLRFGIEQGVDWVALSFVRSAQDVRALRTLIHLYEQEFGIASSSPPLVLVKIEKPEAIERFDEIMTEADGVMVARGDLGVEMPAERVPVLQKMIIGKCLEAAKPVVVATHMLNSMMHEPRPTRAEISDIANAVMDHTDATMLSGETATGEHPLEAVKIMAATMYETEASKYDDLALLPLAQEIKPESNVAKLLLKEKNTQAIVAVTRTGASARLASRFRPPVPIFAVTPDERVSRQLNLSWGVTPMVLPQEFRTADLVASSIKYLLEQEFLRPEDRFLLLSGKPLGKHGHLNLAEARKA